MTPTMRIIGAAGLAGWLGAAPVTGEAPPQEVTTDTPAYCLRLLDQVGELVRNTASPPPQEVTFLSSEGQRMCDQGQTRGGIMRLRRALLLMHQREGR